MVYGDSFIAGKVSFDLRGQEAIYFTLAVELSSKFLGVDGFKST